MSENSFDDDDFDDILGSDIDGFISKDDKKNDLGELNHNEKKEENNLFGGDSNDYDPSKILNSLNSFNDDDFKYRSNKPDKIETIKQSEKPLWSFDNNNNNNDDDNNNEKPLDTESNSNGNNFKDFIFNHSSESKSPKLDNHEPFSILNNNSNKNIIPSTNAINSNNNNIKKENTGFHSPFKDDDSLSGMSLLNDNDDDDILASLGFGTKKTKNPKTDEKSNLPFLSKSNEKKTTSYPFNSLNNNDSNDSNDIGNDKMNSLFNQSSNKTKQNEDM
ncbi:hypothetical protein LY90DRAFT_673380, partial [Neocallimastix californiae]